MGILTTYPISCPALSVPMAWEY